MKGPTGSGLAKKTFEKKGSTGSMGLELAKNTFERINGIRVSEKNLRKKKGINGINGMKVLDPVQKFRLKYNPGRGG